MGESEHPSHPLHRLPAKNDDGTMWRRGAFPAAMSTPDLMEPTSLRMESARGSVVPMPLVLGILLLVSLYLLATLDHRSLDHDELASILVADPDIPLRTLLESRMRLDLHPPLYFFVLHFWERAFGDSVAMMRLLSVVPLAVGGLVVWFVWSRRLVHLPLDLFALFMVTAYGLIQYSDLVRSYSFLLLWGTLLTLILIHAGQAGHGWTRGLPPWVAAALAMVSVLSALTHFFGMLFSGAVIATMTMERLLKRDWRSIMVLSGIGLIVLAVSGGWIVYTREVIARTEGHFWISADPQHLWRAFKETGKTIFSYNIILFGLIGWAVLRYAPQLWRRRDVVLTVSAVGLALLIAVAISVLRTPLTVPRYYVVFMPAVFFVSSLAFQELLKHVRISLRVPAVLGCFGVSLALAIYYHYVVPSEQWRESAAFVLTKCGNAPSTILIPAPNPTSPALYTGELQGFAYRYLLRNSSIAARGATASALAEARTDSCPVLLWAAHVDGEDIDRMLHELEIDETDVEIVAFERAFVVVEK